MRRWELGITAAWVLVCWGSTAAAQPSETPPPAPVAEAIEAPPVAAAPETAPEVPGSVPADPTAPPAPADPVTSAPVPAPEPAPAPPPAALPPVAPAPPAPSAAAQLAAPQAAPAASPAGPPSEPKDARDEDPMNGFGIGPKLGVMMPLAFARTDRYRVLKYDVTPSAVSVDRSVPVTADTQTERGGDVLFSVAVPINLGDGHGIALDLEPTMAFCMSCDESRGDYTYLGVYGGLALRFQPADPFYMSIGAGLRPGVALHDGVEFSAQGELRVPFTFTYYVHHAVGLVFEIAPGFGGYVDLLTDDAAEASMQADYAQGVANERSVSVPVVGDVPYAQVTPVSGSADAVEFGFGMSLDLSIGMRFP